MKPMFWYDPVKRWVVFGSAAGAILLLLGAILFVMLMPKRVEAKRDPEAVDCIEAVGIDRSGSQNNPEVVEAWKASVDKIIDRASNCAGKIWVETVHDRPGSQTLKGITLDVMSVNELDRDAKRDKAKADAHAMIDQLMATPARGSTNLLAWFKSVEAHLEDEPVQPTIRATLFSDGINTTGGVNMLDPGFLTTDVDEVIRTLKLPDCSGWTVRVLGANVTSHGGVPPELADKAEEFWRTYVDACGGEIKRYDVATQ